MSSTKGIRRGSSFREWRLQQNSGASSTPPHPAHQASPAHDTPRHGVVPPKPPASAHEETARSDDESSSVASSGASSRSRQPDGAGAGALERSGGSVRRFSATSTATPATGRAIPRGHSLRSSSSFTSSRKSRPPTSAANDPIAAMAEVAAAKKRATTAGTPTSTPPHPPSSSAVTSSPQQTPASSRILRRSATATPVSWDKGAPREQSSAQPEVIYLAPDGHFAVSKKIPGPDSSLASLDFDEVQPALPRLRRSSTSLSVGNNDTPVAMERAAEKEDRDSETLKCGMCGSCSSMPWWAPERLATLSKDERRQVEQMRRRRDLEILNNRERVEREHKELIEKEFGHDLAVTASTKVDDQLQSQAAEKPGTRKLDEGPLSPMTSSESDEGLHKDVDDDEQTEPHEIHASNQKRTPSSVAQVQAVPSEGGQVPPASRDSEGADEDDSNSDEVDDDDDDDVDAMRFAQWLADLERKEQALRASGSGGPGTPDELDLFGAGLHETIEGVVQVESPVMVDSPVVGRSPVKPLLMQSLPPQGLPRIDSEERGVEVDEVSLPAQMTEGDDVVVGPEVAPDVEQLSAEPVRPSAAVALSAPEAASENPTSDDLRIPEVAAEASPEEPPSTLEPAQQASSPELKTKTKQECARCHSMKDRVLELDMQLKVLSAELDWQKSIEGRHRVTTASQATNGSETTKTMKPKFWRLRSSRGTSKTQNKKKLRAEVEKLKVTADFLLCQLQNMQFEGEVLYTMPDMKLPSS